MNLAQISIRNTQRNLVRTVATVAGVAIAMIAFLLLRAVLSSWTAGAEHSAKDRIATRHRVTFAMPLPKRYVDDIRQLAGVTGVTWFNWFGGRVPGKEDRFFANLAVDARSFLDVYSELELPADQRQRFLEDRRGALVGAQLAEQLGWHVNDRVTLEGSLYPGSWDFTIVGIYKVPRRSMDQSTFYFRWDYLNEGAPQVFRDQVGWIATRVGNASDAGAVAKRIDAVFDRRDVQTLSMSERAMNTSSLGLIATLLHAIQLVSLVILAIMMLMLGNTIAMGVRERTREYGVLRAIGFLPRHVTGFVYGEATVLGLAGGLLGIALAYPIVQGAIGALIEANFTGLFPYFRIAGRDVSLALFISVLLAVGAAAIPARQASKLHVTDALRKVG